MRPGLLLRAGGAEPSELGAASRARGHGKLQAQSGVRSAGEDRGQGRVQDSQEGVFSPGFAHLLSCPSCLVCGNPDHYRALLPKPDCLLHVPQLDTWLVEPLISFQRCEERVNPCFEIPICE